MSRSTNNDRSFKVGGGVTGTVDISFTDTAGAVITGTIPLDNPGTVNATTSTGANVPVTYHPYTKLRDVLDY